MYGPNGLGETYEVFNFSKAGSTAEFVAETALWIFDKYARGDDLITLVSVGGNDAKAVNSPDNFVCTPQDFKNKIDNMLNILQKHSKKVIFVCNNYIDESKLSPKISPFGDGSKSYFTNKR